MLSNERARDGGYSWGIFEDVADPGRFLETFRVDSWLEHLHQRERVTNADRVVQEQVHRLLVRAPLVTRLFAAQEKLAEAGLDGELRGIRRIMRAD